MQVGGNQLGAFALDRVQQRAPQHFRFDTALDEVVLGTGRNRGSPEVLVVQPGQHDYWNGGIAFGDAVQSVHSAGVGQVQVQQHAIGPGGGQLALRVCHRLRPHHPDISDSIGDQVFHEHRIGTVVLDQ